MATPITEINQETDLIGTLTQNLGTSDGLTFTATFIDKKTGLARAPQSTTLEYTVDQGNSASETILMSAVSTANGITTLTIATNGRSIPKFGTASGTNIGNPHSIGAAIGCVDIARPLNLLAQITTQKANLDGTNMPFTGPVTITGPSSYLGVPNLTTIQRLALSPPNGTIVYDTTAGLLYQYIGGSWTTFASGATPFAAVGVAGKVAIANTADIQNNVVTDPVSGAINALSVGNTILTSSGAPNAYEIPATGANGQLDISVIPTNSINQTISALYAPATDVVSDTVSSGDITSNNNLLYFSNGTWHKVISTTSTWYGRLGLCLTPVTGGNSGAVILLRGNYTTSFSNINPTFSNAGTGTDNSVGTTSTHILAFPISYSGAEAIVTGVTVSARQNGAPAGPLWIGLVLPSVENNTAACFFDSTNNLPRGAIIASTTIPQTSFSGSYQNLTASFGGNVKFPSNTTVYLVFALNGTQSNTNNYLIQSGGGGTSGPPNFSFAVTSTSPVGYNIKAYNGTNGGWGLFGSAGWNRAIGTVTTSSLLYFDPLTSYSTPGQGVQSLTNTSQAGIDTLDFNFCPNFMNINIASGNAASSSTVANIAGYIRGDNISGSFNPVTVGYLNGGKFGSVNFLDNSNTIGELNQLLYVNNGNGNGIPQQNAIHVVRLENGCYFYIGYPTSNPISAGASGFNSLNYAYLLTVTS